MARDLGLITTPTTPTLERPEKTPVKPGAFGGAPSNSFGPDAAANVAKSAADFFTGGTQAVGKDITAALPGSVTGVDQLNKTNEQEAKSDIDYIKAIQKKKQTGEKITSAQQQIYDNILKGHAKTTAADLTPAVNKSNAEVAGDFARMGGEVLGGASFAKPGMVTGALTKPLFATAPGAVTVAKGAVDLAGQGIEKAVANSAAKTAVKETEKLTETLTPRVVGKGYEKAGIAGKLEAPGIIKPAGVAGEEVPVVQKAVKAVQGAASILGKKTSDIISTGVGQVTKNVDRLGQTIGEFSNKIVKPFVEKSGAGYNFADLRKSLELVQPTQSLKGAELSTYNRVRERILSSIANKIGPDVKDIRSLAEFRAKAPAGSVPEKLLKGDEDFWDARKMIDDIVDEETKGKAFGSAELNGAKVAYRDMRGAFKQYLSDAYRYPGQMEKVNRANEFLTTQRGRAMNKVGWDLSKFENQFGLVRNASNEANAAEWEKYMDILSGLFDAQKNVATKLGSERGKTLLQLYAKTPTAQFIKRGAIATGIGGGAVAGAKALFGE